MSGPVAIWCVVHSMLRTKLATSLLRPTAVITSSRTFSRPEMSSQWRSVTKTDSRLLGLFASVSSLTTSVRSSGQFGPSGDLPGNLARSTMTNSMSVGLSNTCRTIPWSQKPSVGIPFESCKRTFLPGIYASAVNASLRGPNGYCGPHRRNSRRQSFTSMVVYLTRRPGTRRRRSRNSSTLRLLQLTTGSLKYGRATVRRTFEIEPHW